MESNERKEKQNYIDKSKEIINKIVNEYKQLSSYIEKEIINSLKNFDVKIKNSTKDDKSNKSKVSINNQYKEIIEGYIKIYENRHIKIIKEFIEDLKNMVYEFNPPSINNFSNKSNELQFNSSINSPIIENEDEIEKKLYPNNYSSIFYGDFNNFNEIQSTNELLCNTCKKEKAKYYCSHCNNYSCEECYNNKFKNKEGETNHKFNLMNNTKIENEKKKKIFLKSFLNFIQKLIFKCNYIIKNENQNYVDDDTYKAFQYPSIQDEDNPDNQITYLIELNECYNMIKEKIDIHKSIDEKELSSILMTSFNDMFEGKIQMSKNINNIEEDFYSDEKYESSESDEKTNENYTINKTKDKFYYIVNIINKENYMFEDNNYNKKILEKLTKALSTDKDNISLLTNNNSIFINNFIKSQTFAKLSPKNIRINYPNLHKLYDFKIMIDGLIRLQSQIPVEYLDYKYNFVIPNLSLNNKRGSEIYNPPYGWAGIGLNIQKLYNNNDYSWVKKDNDSWAIAYYGFGNFLTSEEIGKMLNDIIIKGEFKRELSIKCREFDIRHNGKRVGVGIYLSPNVNIAEKNSGTFIFNKKRYKIVLMAKVLINKIKEPEDHSFWIVNQEDIRIYKILVKEKK